MKKYLHILNTNSFFHTLPMLMKEEILESKDTIISQYAKNELVYIEGDECRTLDLILEGSLVVQSISDSGNAVIIKYLMQGEMLGANILFSRNNVYPMTIVAKSETIILHIKKQQIIKICQDSNDFLNKLLQDLSERAVFLTSKIKTFTRKSLREAIIEYLIAEYKYQQSVVIRLSVSKKELAAILGVARSSLSRELQKMKRDGLIDYNSREIVIVDSKIFC